VNDVAPKDRDIAMVFQSYALYPHMSVYDNMAFGLKLRKTPKDEIKRRVDEAADILDIRHLLDRKPRQLSGGQRQRVAVGRAIVREPKHRALRRGAMSNTKGLRQLKGSQLAMHEASRLDLESRTFKDDLVDSSPRAGIRKAALLAEFGQHEVEVLLGLHLAQHGLDIAFRVDDEGRALGAHVFLAIHALLHPDAVGFDELLVLVS